MKRRFDLIVIGSGAGMNVAARAVQEGMNVALLEHGEIGGTCLNAGCIPTKMLIYPADVIRMLEDARPLGVEGAITKVDFPRVIGRMRQFIEEERHGMEEAALGTDNLKWFRATGEFIGDHQLKVGGQEITAEKIVIASGARAEIPPLPGLKEAGYLDNVSVLSIDHLPESLLILGGGFIGCELGHFFSALGSRVTIIGRSPNLLKGEDPEIQERVTKAIGRYPNIDVRTNHEVKRVEVEGKRKVVWALDRSSGEERRFEGEEILVALGRRSNSDWLKPEKGGIETDDRGWIVVDEHLETTSPGIWAVGDALGREMFRHTANYEASVVWNNAFSDELVEVDYHAVPHAVFTHPMIAGVGMTEPQARQAGHELLIGRSKYIDVARGYAMAEEGFVKIIVDAKDGTILGCHLMGSSAPELIQQVTYIMNAEDHSYMPIVRSQVIHPSISEVLIRALGNVAP
ncbi:MAG: dihydrolipoyl dehydrogenase [Methanotrichaceae archaeon]|nr:dihydrolipoyl dehydrogenase [Methanotrichaceae archaeon]